MVVMGHIDHGKSTLLDYIRKTNVVESEIGGITQHISAYEVTTTSGKITFLDTPGHEAFSKMRERGAEAADIAILVVSAEDGVKPQTIEAYKTIAASGTPFIVALAKIDKPEANVEKTKGELAEAGIYLEGYGGNVPFALISAKTGEGVDELLSLILVLAELENFSGDPNAPAEGSVIETNLDPRRGIQATIIIKDGTLRKGTTVGAEGAICRVKIIEDFLGKSIEQASFSSPVRLVGFDEIPKVGSRFRAFIEKEEAAEFAKSALVVKNIPSRNEESGNKKIIPIVLKADTLGSLEAIEREIEKISAENAEFRVVLSGVGPIGEGDAKNAPSDAIVLGFHVKTDRSVAEIAEARGITISLFDIIYKMTEWLTEELEKRRPRVETEESTGRAKILKIFGRTKERQVLGGKVLEGEIRVESNVKILRRDFEIGRGRIVNMQKNKDKVGSAAEGEEFGMLLESKINVVPGDAIESFSLVQK